MKIAENSAAVSLTKKGAVGVVTLARPSTGNAVDEAMARALHDAAIECDADDEVRCVLLRAEGRSFCVGGDLIGFQEAGDFAGELVRSIVRPLHSAMARFARMPKPLVTCVQGPAAGAGLGLALLGDVVIAGRASSFRTAYGAIGFTPDAAVAWLLPKLVGLRCAQDLLLTNRRVGANEAAELRMISRCVDDADLDSEAWETACSLSAGATRAIAATRNLLLNSFHSELEHHLGQEESRIATSAASKDGREGVSAFLSRRKPHFMG